jgi:hypothetical protein
LIRRALFCVVVLASSLSAQTEASVDVGAVSVKYDDALRSTALSVTPMLRLDRARSMLAASGTLSRFESGNWSVQGGADASLFSPTRSNVSAELSGAANANAHRDGSRAGQIIGGARIHVVGAPSVDAAGLWLGASVGRSSDGDTWRLLTQGSAGAWLRHHAFTASVAATPTKVADTVFTDAGVNVMFDRGAAMLAMSLGTRVGSTGGRSTSWGNVSLVAPLAGPVSLVAAAGTYASDPVLSLPGGQYVSFSLRIAARRASARAAERLASTSESPQPQNAIASARGKILAFTVRDAGGDRRTLRVEVAGASRVEIMGDFTDWDVRPLRSSTGGRVWEITLPLSRGTHRMNLRVDGGEWTTPPGLTTIRDDFNGTVGILVVE